MTQRMPLYSDTHAAQSTASTVQSRICKIYIYIFVVVCLCRSQEIGGGVDFEIRIHKRNIYIYIYIHIITFFILQVSTQPYAVPICSETSKSSCASC